MKGWGWSLRFWPMMPKVPADRRETRRLWIRGSQSKSRLSFQDGSIQKQGIRIPCHARWTGPVSGWNLPWDSSSGYPLKTRIGKHSPDEFGRLLKIYNQYPVEELIHPSSPAASFYKNTPNLEVFAEAVRESRNPLCYNGDIFSVADRDRIKERFPDVKTYMMGRGILVNPGLAGELAGEAPADWKRIRRFHDQIYEDYQRISMGDKNVLFKMKELWSYQVYQFSEPERLFKTFKKVQDCNEYEQMIRNLRR